MELTNNNKNYADVDGGNNNANDHGNNLKGKKKKRWIRCAYMDQPTTATRILIVIMMTAMVTAMVQIVIQKEKEIIFE